MRRRLLFLTIGAVVAALAVRRAAQRVGSGGPSGRLGDTVQEFMEEVRVAMAEREMELRAALGLDGRHDEVDAGL